jgi:hypothetical protein
LNRSYSPKSESPQFGEVSVWYHLRVSLSQLS